MNAEMRSCGLRRRVITPTAPVNPEPLSYALTSARFSSFNRHRRVPVSDRTESGAGPVPRASAERSCRVGVGQRVDDTSSALAVRPCSGAVLVARTDGSFSGRLRTGRPRKSVTPNAVFSIRVADQTVHRRCDSRSKRNEAQDRRSPLEFFPDAPADKAAITLPASPTRAAYRTRWERRLRPGLARLAGSPCVRRQAALAAGRPVSSTQRRLQPARRRDRDREQAAV